MRNKLLLFILAASFSITLLSCKTAVREEQPVEPEILTQPEPQTRPQDTLPPSHEVLVREPQEARPVEEDVTKLPDADTYYTLGQSLYNTGHYQDAVVAFKETLSIELHHGRAHYDLARAYLMLNDHAAALSEYKILLKTDPDMADDLREEAVKIVSLNKGYKLIIQVGAFQHFNNAKYLIDDLKEDHLFVYMEKTDRLYKVLIHGIQTMAEGNLIMNEIKKKHDIHPFLIISE